MEKKRINFKEIESEREIFKICYSLWKLSIDEYKKNQFDGDARSLISEAMKYRWHHCRLTGEICLEIYDELYPERKKDWKILYFAALLHDIKKFNHKHSKVGAIWVKDNIRNVVEIDEGEIDEIIKLIRYHKSTCSTEVLGEEMSKGMISILKILKEADSLSKAKEKEYK